MKKQELNYIQQLDIQGLWGLYDVHLPLNPDVNIIVGENGSGKSTLLMILKMVAGLSVDSIMQKSFKASNIEVTWITELGKETFNGHTSMKVGIGFPSFREHAWNGKKISDIQVNYIATFDSAIYSQNDFDEKNKPYIETHLDKELDEMLTRYTEYQTRLLKKSDNRGKSLSDILQKRDWLFDKLNDLFKPTHKRFVESEEDTRPSVILPDGKKLSLFQLSSGEKQLLIILLTVLCQDEKTAILLLDEPEISLHTRWQHELIEIIRTLNPHCQIIAMTHSPSIFNDGWRDKVIWMADVLKEIKPVLEPVNTEGV
jgi:predicted ATP-dependent endonuclease of OLD family